MSLDDRSNDDLLLIVGAERDAHSPGEVAAAEAELKRRLEQSAPARLKRLRRAGAVAAAIGLLMFAWPLFVAATMFSQEIRTGRLYVPDTSALVGMALMACLVPAQAAIGLLLFVAGLGVRRQRDWGRKVILFIVWLGIAYCAVSAVVLAAVTPITWGWDAEAVGFAVFGLAITAFWVAILWKPKRYFSSDEVKRLCRRAPGVGRASRRFLVALVVLVIAVPFLTPLALYAVWWHSSSSELRDVMTHLDQSGAVLDPAQWQPEMPPAQQNAAALLRQAFEAMDEADVPDPPGGESEGLDDWAQLLALETWTPAQAAWARGVVESQAKALELLRQAAGKPHADFGRSYAELFPLMPELCGLRESVALACLSALDAAGRLDYDLAVSDLEVALALARFPDTDPMVIAHLNRMRAAGTAVRCCERVLRELRVPPGVLLGLQRRLAKAHVGLEPDRAMGYERALLVEAYRQIEAGNWEVLGAEKPSRLKALLARPVFASSMAEALESADQAVRAGTGPP